MKRYTAERCGGQTCGHAHKSFAAAVKCLEQMRKQEPGTPVFVVPAK